MDAKHFRDRAARAREMAKSGDDVRLSEMLLEVASDLDAEANAIDFETSGERRRSGRVPCVALSALLVLPSDWGIEPEPVKIVDISRGGAKLETEILCQLGSEVVLHVPEEGLRLSGRIVRTAGLEAGVVFEGGILQDTALARYLKRRCEADAPQSAAAN